MIPKNHFSEDIKKIMVMKLLQPRGPSVLELSNKEGISKTALYNWLKKYNSVNRKDNPMSIATIKKPVSNGLTAEDKFKAIIDTNALTDTELGTYCREQGIYATNLQEWKQQCLNSFAPIQNNEYKNKYLHLEKDLKKLKSELNRKDRALAEASALLILQKKAALIWGDLKDDE
jgi:transposase-like protein